nr:hypothetical protein [Tanacetum cinerariifolium]
MHIDVEDLIESVLNSKLLSINLKSQRLDKEKQEVKNIIEQSPKCRTRLTKCLKNFKVIHNESIIPLNNTPQISSVIAIPPILTTKEPDKSLSMGDDYLCTILEMKSDEVIKSSVKNLVPIPSESEVTFDNKKLNAEIADTILESLSPSPIPVEDSDSQMEEIDLFLATDYLMPPGIENDDYDSKGDIYFLEELLSDHPLPLLENESSKFDHHDDPSFPCPPSEPPDVELRESKNYVSKQLKKRNNHHKTPTFINLLEKYLIESGLNSKLLSINLKSQRLDKEKQEVKNIIEQSPKCGTRLTKCLKNFKVIHNESIIPLNNTPQISSVIAIPPVLTTKEPDKSLSMGDNYLSTILETKSDEVIKSSVKNLVPIPSESEVTFDNEKLNAEIADTILESLSPSPIPVEDSDSQIEEIDLFLATDYLMPPGIENDDYDSKRDIYFFEELLSDHPLPLLENESSKFDHHDDPSFPCPPSEPSDVEVFFDFVPDTGVLTTKVVKGISEHYVLMPNILPTLPNLDPDLDFTPSHDSLGSGNKIFDTGIFIEVQF